MPTDNSSTSRSTTSNYNLWVIGRKSCFFSSFKVDRVLQFATIGHKLLPFKLFWKFPVKRFKMEIFSHQFHVCNNFWVLKNNSFGGCVLEGFIHQWQDGLFRGQCYPHTDQSPCFSALGSCAKAIAAAAAKWILGIKSKFARPAPVTVDTFHIHLTSALSIVIKACTFFSF